MVFDVAQGHSKKRPSCHARMSDFCIAGTCRSLGVFVLWLVPIVRGFWAFLSVSVSSDSSVGQNDDVSFSGRFSATCPESSQIDKKEDTSLCPVPTTPLLKYPGTV